MKFIPNNNKQCKICGKGILYNEEYRGKDILSADGLVNSEYRHEFCWPDITSQGLSGVSMYQLGQGASAMSLSASAISAARLQAAAQAAAQWQNLRPGKVIPFPSPKLASPLTPYGRSLKPSLWKRILRLLFGGHDGKEEAA